MRSWLIVLLLLSGSPAVAGNIQYLATTGQVTGISDQVIPTVPGYEVVSIAESVSAIAWPIPSGCPSGQPSWAVVDDPAQVTVAGDGLVLRAGLVVLTSTSTLFTNRCEPVASAAEVWAMVDQVLASNYAPTTVLPFLDRLNVASVTVCPSSDSTQDCVDVRAAMVTLNDIAAGAPATLKAFVEAAVQLQADAQTLITAQSW